MTNLGFKTGTIYVALIGFLTLGTTPSAAQVISMSIAPDAETLVSPPQEASDHTPKHNLETTLVDIKAVDAPAFHIENGKSGVGSEERYGQGIIIDSAGIIATNRHITGNAVHIFVALSDGKIFEAKLLRNSDTDLSLIKIDAPFPLRAISMADPSELQIGINVVAVANAGLNAQRMRDGQVINVFKGISSNNVELLEMNIPLKQGDSGGPILSQEGSLLGLIMGKRISDPSKSYAIACYKIQQEYFKYRNSILN